MSFSGTSISCQLQFLTNLKSQSHLQSPREKQQSRPVYPWSAHASPFGQSSSPFLRDSLRVPPPPINCSLFTEPRVSKQRSIRDLSTGFLHSSSAGQRKRSQHTLRTPRLVLINTTPLIWCGRTGFSDQSAQNRCNDDSYYPVNLVVGRTFLMPGPAPADRSLLCSSISRVDPHRG